MKHSQKEYSPQICLLQMCLGYTGNSGGYINSLESRYLASLGLWGDNIFLGEDECCQAAVEYCGH